MNKPKSITQLSKEQLEDLCLNLMHTDKVKTEMINQLEEENKQIKERIEYYYEFDEELKKEDLPEELRPYYKNQDCCRYIVELRKENKELQQKVNQLETNRDEAIDYIKIYTNDFQEQLSMTEILYLLEILEKR